MLSRRVLRSARFIRTYASQCDANHSRDPLRQAHAQGKKSHDNPHDTTPLDAASSHALGHKQAAHGDLSGNPEGVGFADQVGSQSASADESTSATSPHDGFAGQENTTRPSLTDVVKNKLGWKTTAGEDKRNRRGGQGVTSSGAPRFDTGKRTLWTSAVLPKENTKGQVPKASRQPKEKTNADQNEHLSHSPPQAKGEKKGKGNAANNPTLPSHQFSDEASKGPSGGTRGFSTTARTLADKKTKHTADSYFKDIDSTPASSVDVHQVDSSAAGAQVQPTNEPQTGSFSQEGPGDQEYETVSKHEQPYDTPPSSGPERDQKLGYGGTGAADPGGRNARLSKEGPQGTSKGGRKPEGRS